jgi:uncharacterized membrane protein YfcA
MALATMVPLALIGALRYWKNPEVEFNGSVITLIVLGAAAGTIVGTELVARLPAGVLRKSFAVFLAVVAVRMFTAAPKGEKPRLGGQTQMKAVDPGDRNVSAEPRRGE